MSTLNKIKQTKSLINNIAEAKVFNDVIKWIRENLQPEEVFDKKGKLKSLSFKDKCVYERVCKINGHHYVPVCIVGVQNNGWKAFCEKCGNTIQIEKVVETQDEAKK